MCLGPKTKTLAEFLADIVLATAGDCGPTKNYADDIASFREYFPDPEGDSPYTLATLPHLRNGV